MALLVEKKFLGVRKRPNLSNFFVFFCTMRPWPFWISIWIPNECRCDFKIYALNLWTLICNSLKIWNKNPNTTSKRLITHCFSLLRNKMMLSQKIYIISQWLKTSKSVACKFCKDEVKFDHQNNKDCSKKIIQNNWLLGRILNIHL